MTKWHVRALLALVLASAGLVRAQLPPPTAETIAALQAQREALFDGRIDVPQLSRDIGTVTREADRLDKLGQYQQALDQLKTLERQVPLRDFPSIEVHLVASRLYQSLGQPEASRQHRERADAYLSLLQERIGTGDTPEDPLRVVMNHEMIEWVRSRLVAIVDARAMPGRPLMVVTYQGPTTGNQPRTLYVRMDPRTEAIASRSFDRFAPMPTAEMPARAQAQLALARQKRERFLADRSFAYMELDERIRTLMKESIRLDMDGKPQEALAKLRELEQLRAIAEIPTPRVLAWYSYLLGKNGQTVLQQEMRGLIFGVQQAIAHSGDGRSLATAIEVVLLEEEYEWLGEKKLKLVLQALRPVEGRHYDVMTVEDAQGRKSEVFFDVSKLYERRRAPVVPLSGFDAVWRDAEQQFASGPARDYLKQHSAGFWNDRGVQRFLQWPAQKAIAECVTAVFPGPERVRLAFQLDAQGVVQQAHTDQAGYIDQCVKEKTAGLRVPAPPAAPFLLCTRYEKTGADRTLVAGCGPAPISEDCQRQGAGTRCNVQMR